MEKDRCEGLVHWLRIFDGGVQLCDWCWCSFSGDFLTRTSGRKSWIVGMSRAAKAGPTCITNTLHTSFRWEQPKLISAAGNKSRGEKAFSARIKHHSSDSEILDFEQQPLKSHTAETLAEVSLNKPSLVRDGGSLQHGTISLWANSPVLPDSVLSSGWGRWGLKRFHKWTFCLKANICSVFSHGVLLQFWEINSYSVAEALINTVEQKNSHFLCLCVESWTQV